MEGFNYKLVVGVWGGVIAATILLTVLRMRKKQKGS